MSDLFNFDDIPHSNNVSIHLRNLTRDDLRLLDDVLHETGQKTQAKALLDAYSGFLMYKRKYADLEKRYLDLVHKRKSQ